MDPHQFKKICQIFHDQYLKKTFELKVATGKWFGQILFFQFTGIRHALLPHPRSMELANILSQLIWNPRKGTLGSLNPENFSEEHASGNS